MVREPHLVLAAIKVKVIAPCAKRANRVLVKEGRVAPQRSFAAGNGAVQGLSNEGMADEKGRVWRAMCIYFAKISGSGRYSCSSE